MVRRFLFGLVVSAFIVSSSSVASAGIVNYFFRSLGLGWSDGYHAHEQMPQQEWYPHAGYSHQAPMPTPAR